MKQTSERGFTLVEIMIVVAIIALLAAIAIPNVLRGRTTANESAAIGNMRALISSLEMARSVNQTYPDGANWRPVMYGADCAAATLPNPDFGPPSFCLVLPAAVQGYTYTYTGAAAPAQTYTLLSVPVTMGTTGTRCFYADQTGLVRHCSDAAATCTVANLAGENTIDAQPNLCNNSQAT
jgi:prepilin-type N-terminal cleavage/methylation domain-containing protein